MGTSEIKDEEKTVHLCHSKRLLEKTYYRDSKEWKNEVNEINIDFIIALDGKVTKEQNEFSGILAIVNLQNDKATESIKNNLNKDSDRIRFLYQTALLIEKGNADCIGMGKFTFEKKGENLKIKLPSKTKMEIGEIVTGLIKDCVPNLSRHENATEGDFYSQRGKHYKKIINDDGSFILKKWHDVKEYEDKYTHQVYTKSKFKYEMEIKINNKTEIEKATIKTNLYLPYQDKKKYKYFNDKNKNAFDLGFDSVNYNSIETIEFEKRIKDEEFKTRLTTIYKFLDYEDFYECLKKKQRETRKNGASKPDTYNNNNDNKNTGKFVLFNYLKDEFIYLSFNFLNMECEINRFIHYIKRQEVNEEGKHDFGLSYGIKFSIGSEKIFTEQKKKWLPTQN